MRISDWSSDVCSSDLWPAFASVLTGETNLRPSPPSGAAIDRIDSVLDWLPQAAGANPKRDLAVLFGLACGVRVAASSEEPTSDIQYLMRISYAVCCFNTKTTMLDIKSTHACIT